MAARSLVPRLLLMVGTTLLLLGASELALRLAEGGDGVRFVPVAPSTREAAGTYVPHPTRFFALAPHHRADPLHAGRYATGTWPFRGPPSSPRPPGAITVAVLGDSCVYGFGVDVADSLPHRIALSLARDHGFDPTSLLVLNFGVPGYSTVQIDALLEEVLARHDPDAVVIAPAAWNDQAPALWLDDLELERRARAPTFLEELRRRSRLVSRLVPDAERPAEQDVLAAWAEGRYLVGPRVPPDALARRLDTMAERCRAAQRPLVFVAASHPDETRADHPRTGADAAAVRDAAGRADLPLVDGAEVLARAGLTHQETSATYVDYVHPAPPAQAALGRAVARALAPLLSDAAARAEQPPQPPESVGPVTPAQVSCLGDVQVAVALPASALTGSVMMPRVSVTVGGQPLLDLHVSAGVARGLLPTNAPGVHDVIVRTDAGSWSAPGALTLAAPRPSADGARLAVTGLRAGDRCQLFVDTATRAAAEWTARGPWWLPPGAAELGGALVADASGTARLELQAPAPPGVVLQGLVVPRGEADLSRTAGRFTEPSRRAP